MAKYKRRQSPEQVAYMVSEYKRGRSMPEIAEELILSAATVRNYLIEEGVERRAPGNSRLVTQELIDLAAEMQAEGVAWKTIAKKLGVSHSALDKSVRKQKQEHLLMPAKKFNEKQTAYIVEQYGQGRSSHSIAREMGVTMQTILVYLEEQNIVRRVAGAKKRVTPAIIEKAQALRAEGNKWAYIEKVVGVSKETIRQASIRMKGGKGV